jgi:diacylglycerol kinase family enzyme
MGVTVVACVNPRSGGLKGAKVLTVLKEILGPEKCLNVLEGTEASDWLFCNFGREESLRILICGGDGTLSRVIDGYARVLHSLIEDQPSATAAEQRRIASSWAFVPIPIGTGNDLARTLGWGSNLVAVSALFFECVVRFVADSRPIPIDVWVVTRRRLAQTWLQKRASGIRACLSAERAHSGKDAEAVSVSHEPLGNAETRSSTDSSHLEQNGYARRFIMLSYLSLGCDADVELLFNSRRDANPNRYRSQTLNFISHAIFGMERTMLSRARPLAKEHINLFVDGKPVQIPKGVQSLLIANIPSYGAGADPGGITRRQRRAMARKLRQPICPCSCMRSEQLHRDENAKAQIGATRNKHGEQSDFRHRGSRENADSTAETMSATMLEEDRPNFSTNGSKSSMTLAYVDDQQLDIMAMDSLVHFIWIKLGREARRLARGRTIRIELEEKKSAIIKAARPILAKPVAVQCDGEAWTQARNEVIEIEPFSFQVCFILGPLYREATERSDAKTRAEKVFVSHYLKSTSAPSGVFSQDESAQYIQHEMHRARRAFLVGASFQSKNEHCLSERDPEHAADSGKSASSRTDRTGTLETGQNDRESVERTHRREPSTRSQLHGPRKLFSQLFSCFGIEAHQGTNDKL